MFKFWALILEPVLRAIGARRVVEIGVDSGANTRHLLEYCASTGGHLDYIDPCPTFDVESAQAKYGACSTFHKCASVDAIPRLEPPDAVLIDGDHNWYTVHRELELLAARAKKTKSGFPLVLFHDVSWPYGRRDLYYAPERIPQKHQQPHAQKGMLPGVSELVDKGGLNPQLWNALKEGGPHNGVLTAVEEFVAESKAGTLHVYPILFGLGILVPTRLAEHEALQAELARWQSPAGLQVLLELVERERTTEMAQSHAELRRLGQECGELWKRVGDLSSSLTGAHAEVQRLTGHLERLGAECARLAADADSLRRERDRLRADLDLIHASTTWRWTSIVRTAGAMLSGKDPWHAGNGRNGK
jgi:hypothetical protein